MNTSLVRGSGRCYGDGPHVIIRIVRPAEVAIMAAFRRQFLVLVNEEVADIEMLMGGEPLAALEEKYVASSSQELRAYTKPGPLLTCERRTFLRFPA